MSLSDTEDSIADAKAALRKQMRTVRTQASAEQGTTAAEGLKHQILSHFESTGGLAGQVVAGYVSIHAELDPGPALQALEAQGALIALPVTGELGDPLVFRAWRHGEPLDMGRFGTFEPPDTAPSVDPDVVLVPLLAFDGKGNRLGFGGGYYDRTLAELKMDKKIAAYGIAFDAQEVAHVPTNTLDEGMDGVFTESRLAAFTARFPSAR